MFPLDKPEFILFPAQAASSLLSPFAAAPGRWNILRFWLEHTSPSWPCVTGAVADCVTCSSQGRFRVHRVTLTGIHSVRLGVAWGLRAVRSGVWDGCWDLERIGTQGTPSASPERKPRKESSQGSRERASPLPMCTPHCTLCLDHRHYPIESAQGSLVAQGQSVSLLLPLTPTV